METSFILDIVLIFVAALLGGYIADRFKQSPIIGYILGGIVLGPYVAGLVKDFTLINDLSEIGVILLLFTLGIEFNLSRLKQVGKVAVIGGALQILVMAAIGLVGGYMLGFTLYESIYFGAAISISSTMVVLRSLGDRGELSAVHSQLIIGILIVQDLSVILMVLLLPELKDLNSIGALPILLSLAKSVIFVGVMLFLAQRVIPIVMDRAARSSSPDIFLILSLSLSLGIAALAHSFGLAVSLGAFLAGIVVSESSYAHEIMGKITSLRDTFVILFFISVGMLVDPNSVFANWQTLLTAIFLIVPIKFAVVFGLVKLFGYHGKIAFATGVGLAQTGEFSFVLAKIGLGKELIPLPLYNAILASAIITIILTPLLINAVPAWYARLRKVKFLSGLLGDADITPIESDLEVTYENHIIICGHGRVGQSVASALRQMEIPIVIIDYNYLTVENLKNQGVPVVYGDASNDIVLSHASPQSALLAVIALPDIYSNYRAIRHLRRINPDILLIARAHNDWEKKILAEEGVTEIVQPEKEASLEMLRHVILHLNQPRQKVEEYLENIYLGEVEKLPDDMRKDELKVKDFKIGPKAPWMGKPLRHAFIKESTGCYVVAIIRPNGEVITNPDSRELLLEGDRITVLGTSEQLKSFAVINEGGNIQG